MKLKRDERGQSLVEFAIILPVIMLLIMGAIEFGLVLNTYLKIENAAREGARIGIVGSTDSEIKSVVTAVSPSLEASKLTILITPGEATRDTGDTLKVEVKYQYTMIVPLISNLFGGSIELSSQTSMRVE